MRQIKKLMQRGLLDPEQEDPFSLFVASTNIRYCFYSETHKILGNTYGMCVLQVGLYFGTLHHQAKHRVCSSAASRLSAACYFSSLAV